jgi:GTP-dependent phosphoenolpyruvate carboxykinase
MEEISNFEGNAVLKSTKEATKFCLKLFRGRKLYVAEFCLTLSRKKHRFILQIAVQLSRHLFTFVKK